MKSDQEDIVYEYVPDDWPWVWAIWDPVCLDWQKGITSDEEMRYTALSQSQLPVPITENLYLGNMLCINSIEKLKARGITAVLNMAGTEAFFSKNRMQAFETNGIQYKKIDADDEYDYPLLRKHWQEAFDFIQSTTKDGKCVVNCVAGVNRSGLIATAYFMMSTQTNVLESVKHVRRQRGNVAMSNHGFQAQLVAMARKHDLLGPQPGTGDSIVKQQVPSPSPHHWAINPTPRVYKKYSHRH